MTTVISSRDDEDYHFKIFKWFGSYLMWQSFAGNMDTKSCRQLNESVRHLKGRQFNPEKDNIARFADQQAQIPKQLSTIFSTAQFVADATTSCCDQNTKSNLYEYNDMDMARLWDEEWEKEDDERRIRALGSGLEYVSDGEEPSR